MAISKYLLVSLASFTVSLILTPFVKVLATRFGKVAEVRGDRWHKKPTPLLGGIAIWASWLIIAILFTPDFQ
ncbi:MAG: undecaprenyl/decaprenyl-phosphate alpha-N-acetylglucosaminyl 1-phosphate transferase, partial [Nitrospinae bacterium]|nr:undecaprenyl/decaprenyl-phosphate alpha-N-acetylglucosaminyl 1-phosphate transferase [Nitrospinota bacterium]